MGSSAGQQQLLDWDLCLCLAALGAGEVQDLFGQV